MELDIKDIIGSSKEAREIRDPHHRRVTKQAGPYLRQGEEGDHPTPQKISMKFRPPKYFLGVYQALKKLLSFFYQV